jgi:hypothetical protein
MKIIKPNITAALRRTKTVTLLAFFAFLAVASLRFYSTSAQADGNCKESNLQGPCSPSTSQQNNLNPKGCDAQTNSIDCYDLNGANKTGTVNSVHCGAADGNVLSGVEVKDEVKCVTAPPSQCCRELSGQPCVINHYSHSCKTATNTVQCHQKGTAGAATVSVDICEDTPGVPDQIVSSNTTSTKTTGCN